MHYFTSHGVEFHYNGDYSGYIKVSQRNGFSYEAPFDLIVSLSDMEGSGEDIILAARDFVADAVRRTLISSLEQMNTEDILTLPEALKMYEESRENTTKEDKVW
jgi:hypothetical protein